MTETIQLEGIEKAVVVSWGGWDGDQAYLTFSDVVLQPAVYNQLEAEGLDLTLQLIVDIDLEESTTTISAYDDQAVAEKDTPEWERTFKLNVSVDFNS